MDSDRIKAQYARHPQKSLERLAGRLAKKKWCKSDIIREDHSHASEFGETGADKEFLDRYIIANIAESYDRRARIKQRILRSIWERRNAGASFDAALPERMARFRQYEDIPFSVNRNAVGLGIPDAGTHAEWEGYLKSADPHFTGTKQEETIMSPAMSYAAGICKAAEVAGIDPRVITRNTMAKTAMEKRAFTLVELLTVAGLLGGGMYGTKKLAIDPYLKRKALANRTTGQKFVDGVKNMAGQVKNLASQHPYASTAAAVGIPLAAYGAYKALKPSQKPQPQYPDFALG